MVPVDSFLNMIRSLSGIEEVPHFDKTSFKISKKIFATYNEVEKRICVKLSEIDQSVFSSFDKNVIHPVPNKWGKQGWTLIYLDRVEFETLEDAVQTAYDSVKLTGKN